MDIFTKGEISIIFLLVLVIIMFLFNKQLIISTHRIIKKRLNITKDVNAKKNEEYTPREKIVPEAFDNLKPIESPPLRYILYCLPGLCFFIAILLVIMQRINIYQGSDYISDWLPIIISGYCSAGLCLYTQRKFIEKIPETFRTLWYRKIIVGIVSSDLGPSNKDFKGFVLVEERFSQFISNMQKWLTHWAQFFMGSFILGLTFLWNPLDSLKNPLFWEQLFNLLLNFNQMGPWQAFIQGNWHMLNELPVSLISFVIGLMIWRMFVCSIYICKMMKEFEIEPKLGHPDMAGGFSPIGNLCLWSLIIADIPIIYFSFGLLLGALETFKSDYVPVPYYFVLEFLLLFVILGICPLLLFFFCPVWKVHQQMSKWKKSKQELLYQIGHSINELESRLLNEAGKLDSKDFGSIQTELEGRKQVYTRNDKLPILPLNMGIIMKLFISCVVPLFLLIFIPYISKYLPILSNSVSSIPSIITYGVPVFSLFFQLISLNKNT